MASYTLPRASVHAMSRRAARCTAIIAMLAVVGCIHRAAPKPEIERADDAITLTVENRHWLDVTISIVHDGQTTRIGEATAATTKVFALRPYLIGQSGLIRLSAHPIGTGADVRARAQSALLSETIRAVPGSSVVWELEIDLRRSTVSVY